MLLKFFSFIGSIIITFQVSAAFESFINFYNKSSIEIVLKSAGFDIPDFPIHELPMDQINRRLSALTIQNQNLIELPPLHDFTNLVEVRITNSQLRTLDGLANIQQLRRLDLSDNLIQNISSIATLSRLESLHLEGNTIRSFAPLNGLNHLTFLSLSLANSQQNVLRELNLPSLHRIVIQGTISDETISHLFSQNLNLQFVVVNHREIPRQVCPDSPVSRALLGITRTPSACWQSSRIPLVIPMK